MQRTSYLFAAVLVLAALGVALGAGWYWRAPPPPLTQPAWGETLPHFSLPDLDNPEQNLSPADFLGEVYLLNYWASWCVSCKREHAFLLQLAQSGRVKIYSVNYHDTLDAARATLANSGNPYTRTVFDAHGATSRSYGIVGTPITFVVDKRGKLRYKHLGPLDADSFAQIIGPLVDELKAN
jgi:cytochrome c biogenesis protein CcmG, thiol:disulfide interchange protein DsbE